MKLLSIIVPVYNDEKSILTFCNQITKTLKDSNDNYECIFVENGSHDNTLTQLRAICSDDYHFHYISMRHNISILEAFYTGVQYANGDYILFMELQHPAFMIPEFYNLLSVRNLTCAGGLLQDGTHSAKKQRFFKIFDAAVITAYAMEEDFGGFKDVILLEKDIFWISYKNLERRELSTIQRILQFLNISHELRIIYFFILLIITMIVLVPCILVLHFELNVNYTYYTCLLFIGCIFIVTEILHNQFSGLQARYHSEQIKDSTFH